MTCSPSWTPSRPWRGRAAGRDRSGRSGFCLFWPGRQRQRPWGCPRKPGVVTRTCVKQSRWTNGGGSTRSKRQRGYAATTQRRWAPPSPGLRSTIPAAGGTAVARRLQPGRRPPLRRSRRCPYRLLVRHPSLSSPIHRRLFLPEWWRCGQLGHVRRECSLMEVGQVIPVAGSPTPSRVRCTAFP